MSSNVRDADYRALMKLAGEASELPQDLNARRKHIIGGLCQIVGGSMANAFEFRTSGPGGIGKYDTHIAVNVPESAQKPIRDFPKSQNRPLLLPHLGQIPTGGYLTEYTFCLLSRRFWRPRRAMGSEGKPVISATNPTL